jgi:hypothetical protein
LWQLAARGTGAARAGAGNPGAVACAQAAFASIARLTVTSRGLENIRMGYRSEANFDVLSTTILLALRAPKQKGLPRQPFLTADENVACQLVGPGRDRRARDAVRSAIAASWRRSERETQRTKVGIVMSLGIGSGIPATIAADETMAVTPVMTARAAMVGSHRSRRHCGRKNKCRRTSENLSSHRNLPFRVNRSQ